MCGQKRRHLAPHRFKIEDDRRIDLPVRDEEHQLRVVSVAHGVPAEGRCVEEVPGAHFQGSAVQLADGMPALHVQHLFIQVVVGLLHAAGLK